MSALAQDPEAAVSPAAGPAGGATSAPTAAASSAVPPALVARLVRGVVAAPGAATETSVAPFTGAPLGEIPLSTEADVEAAYATARRAQPDWAARPVRDRTAVLLRLHDLVLDRQDELLDLLQTEAGKSRKHGFEEIVDVALNARHYARRGARYLRPQRHPGLFPLVGTAVEVRHPKGVVGIVSPWNYPLTLAVSDALPAFVAGNAVVHKPDTQTALTALYVRELALEAGLPPELWQVVVGDGPTIGQAVLDRGDFVCFTGSTPVGREVAQRAAARLVGASLELGGKNPMLVLDDADLDKAALAAMRDCFANAGQLCVSMERVYVDASVHDVFLERIVSRTKALRLGTGLDYTADVGSLISPAQLDRVRRFVDDAVAKGATVHAGGQARPDIGPYFFEPTVLTGVTEDMDLCRGEVFGPVVAVASVRDEDEALARANDTTYGLNASVWTRDLRRGRRVAERIKAGTVSVNEAYGASWGATASPMGGVKDSGLGRRHGRDGILKYTEPQTIGVQRLLGFDPVGGMSHEQWVKALTASLRAFKAIGRP